MLISRIHFFVYLFFLFPYTIKAQSADNFQEKLWKEYSPQDYSYYKFGEGILNQGKQIADELSFKLDNYKQLIETQDPDELLADFETKMQDIKAIEANLNKQSFNAGWEIGDQLSSSINSGDTKGAIVGAIGALGALSEVNRAEEELKARKVALAEQRRQQMSQIYWNAIDFNNQAKQNYIRRAAYAENPKDEQYNLAFLNHLDCYAESMKANWSPSNTYWLQNNCGKPKQPVINTIENKFVAKDIQYIKIAQRKFEYYQKSKYKAFLDAAISYAAAACKANPKASHYYTLGSYYQGYNTILALSTILTAKELNPSFFKNAERKEKLALISDEAEAQINRAIKTNNKEYLTAFLNAGIDKTIRINDRSILEYAILLDNPDAVQLVLNKYIDGLNQSQIQDKLQKTIMLCALANSVRCIERFIELGVSMDFKIGHLSPVGIAVENNSMRAAVVLADITQNPDLYKDYIAKLEAHQEEVRRQIQEERLLAAKMEKERKEKKERDLVANIEQRVELMSSYDDLVAVFNEHPTLIKRDEVKDAIYYSKNLELYKNASIGNPDNEPPLFATAKDPLYQQTVGRPQTMIEEGKVKITFLRPWRFAGAAAGYDVVVNDYEFKLSNNSAHTIEVDAGPLEIYMTNLKWEKRKMLLYPFQREIVLVVDPMGWTVHTLYDWRNIFEGKAVLDKLPEY